MRVCSLLLCLLVLVSSNSGEVVSSNGTSPIPAGILADISQLQISFSCNMTNFTEILIQSVSDFRNIVSLRMKYPKTQLVVMTLTQANSYDNQGSLLTAAYESSVNLTDWNNSLSCTYIRGQGMNSTSIKIQNYKYAVGLYNVNDLVFSDLSIDRDDSFNNVSEYCLWLSYYNKTNPDLTSSLCSPLVTNLKDESKIAIAGATHLSNSNRIGFLRFRTSGGISFQGGSNHSIVSSFISGKGYVINLNSNFYVLVYNTTITAPWSSGIFTNSQQFAVFSHNYIADTGMSCFYSRRSVMQTIQYNYCHNFTFLPGAGGGAAGFYSWNAQGWRSWGRVVQYNWFWAPLQKCYYLDSQDSNVIFDSNVCATQWAELNGGRYNYFTNNLYLFIKNGTAGSLRIGDVNCVGTNTNNPTAFSSCQGAMAWTGDGAIFPSTIWKDRYTNGTLKYNISEFSGFPVTFAPQLKWDTWCTPLSAGPYNLTCANANNTYSYNGTSYPIPCEALPTNNKLEFVVLYTSTNQPTDYIAGFGCDCCSTPNPSYPNITFKSSPTILKLNYINNSHYKTKSWNTTTLLGYNISWDQPRFNPKDFKISTTSQLGIEQPQLLNIPFSQIGLLPYTPPPTASPTNTAPTSGPTKKEDNKKDDLQLSTGAIAGISIGAIVAVCVITAITIYVIRLKKQNSRGRTIEAQVQPTSTNTYGSSGRVIQVQTVVR
jgi:hypothetical protein